MSKEEFKEPDNLDLFDGWDQESSTENFFGEGIDSEEEKTKKPESKKEEDDDEEKEDLESKKDEDSPEEEVEEEEEDFFSEDDDNEEEEEEDDKDEKPKDNPKDKKESKSVLTLNYLKEKGIVDFELEEGEELTEEKAEELLEDSYEKGVEEKIKELFEDLPDFVKNLNKFALNGGDIGKFIENIKNQSVSGISKDMDLEDEKNQEAVFRVTAKEEGLSDEEIESQLEYFKESGKLKNLAEKKFDRWKKKNEENEKKLIEEQNERKRIEKENMRKYKEKISSALKEKDEINGIKFSKEETRVIPSYMTERNIKTQNGQRITEMQKDLFEALRDENKSVIIAKLLKSDFDFESIAKHLNTKITRKVKENLQRSKEESPKISKGGTKTRSAKSLSDYF